MVFRVTPQTFANNSLRYSQLHLSNLATLQARVSSGLRVQKPSDDPGVIGALYANKADVARMEIDATNIETARAKLNNSVSQLISANEALTRANALTLEGIQSLETERETLAREVDGILNLMVQVANSTDGGDPLYAGTSKSTEPFQVSRDAKTGEIDAVVYVGNDERSRTVVGVLATVDTLYAGSEVFMNGERGDTVFVGETGAAVGTGTNSSTGYGLLTVRNAGIVFGGSTGLQSGLSAVNDTIIGDYVLTVDGPNQTLALDGGTPVPFSSGATDVAVRAPNGGLVHIDTSSLNNGFAGDITVTGQGFISVDEGQTEVSINFSSNQVITDGATGAVTNVDTRSVRLAGDDQLEDMGTASVFQVLIDVRDELRNTRNLTGQRWEDAMTRRLGDVQRVHGQLLEVVAEQSATLENLDSMQFRAEGHRLEIQQVIADTESVDVAQTVIDLQAEQNALQYTYAISVRLMSTSLLDYLR